MKHFDEMTALLYLEGQLDRRAREECGRMRRMRGMPRAAASAETESGGCASRSGRKTNRFPRDLVQAPEKGGRRGAGSRRWR